MKKSMLTNKCLAVAAGLTLTALCNFSLIAKAQSKLTSVPPAAGQKPNIILIVPMTLDTATRVPTAVASDRGMPTPNIDRLAEEGMTFFSFYAQPSCTPGSAAMQTGRIPNRSGMTSVAFQGQGGGLPAAEWTLASVLKQAGYKTYFTGKWHSVRRIMRCRTRTAMT